MKVDSVGVIMGSDQSGTKRRESSEVLKMAIETDVNKVKETVFASVDDASRTLRYVH